MYGVPKRGTVRREEEKKSFGSLSEEIVINRNIFLFVCRPEEGKRSVAAGGETLYYGRNKPAEIFAIISHPDAGKTTLTEKFLLYGGAINLAGSVKGKATARHAVSDWMEIEKERGISVTSSVLQFEYDGYCINILDTPGHQDFSEDTYRTLMAADSAVMVIDGSKGVEAQTIKLFKVCVMRGIPIFTFINKMDREAMDPFELIDQISRRSWGSPPARSTGPSVPERISRAYTTGIRRRN